MSLRRLATTIAVMAALAAVLRLLTAGLPGPAALGHAQALADTSGPDRLVAALVAALAWLAWGWGALGLLLTALSAAPGLVGAAARATGRLVLPASTRRAAAIALGLGLTVATPALSACAPATGTAAAVESLPGAAPVPDWPAAPTPSAATPSAPTPTAPTSSAPTPTPQAPTGPTPTAPTPGPPTPAGDHVVVPGDCLWDIAEADLRLRTGVDPADDVLARAVEAWWAGNTEVIGPDPDLLLPGQVLRAPAPLPTPIESETPE